MDTEVVKNDFSVGSVKKSIVKLAIPLTLAQLINVLYNVVDRIYIGHLEFDSTNALSGVGLALPIITLITGFANLFGMGGASLASIARGAHEKEKAASIMGTSFTMLLLTGAALTALLEIFHEPLLYLVGASDDTIGYAKDYLVIYLAGTLFQMLSLGMNSFINSQGFAKTGMMTVLIGAGLNIALDPVMIFTLNLGVRGAAIATIISQAVSATWAVGFLFSKKAILRLTLKNMRVNFGHLKKIVALGLSAFVMNMSTGVVQVVNNITLGAYGGDVYIGVMTIVNSLREVVYTPLQGLAGGAQPVVGYNYGARRYDRVRQSVFFMTAVSLTFTMIVWAIMLIIPESIIRLFTSDPELIEAGVPAMHIYFFGLFLAALQFSGQYTFVAVGRSKEAIFFSTLRKFIIVVPLALTLPLIESIGVKGVFLAEPISSFVASTACYVTMYFKVLRPMKRLSLGAKPDKSAASDENERVSEE